MATAKKATKTEPKSQAATKTKKTTKKFVIRNKKAEQPAASVPVAQPSPPPEPNAAVLETLARMEVALKELATNLTARVTELERRLSLAGRVFAPVSRDDVAAASLRPVVSGDEPLVSPGAATRRITVDGRDFQVGIGFTVWCAYLPETLTETPGPGVYEASVVSISQNTVTVNYKVDDSEEDASLSQIFPFNDEGKRAAQLVVDEHVYELEEEKGKHAKMIIHLLTGELTQAALSEYGHRASNSMASIVGLSPFTDLKGVKGDDRWAIIIKAAKKFREVPKTTLLLKDAQQSLVRWEEFKKKREAEALQKTESLRDKAKQLRDADERLNGRSISETHTPLAPRPGDLIKAAGEWYKVDTIRKDKVYATHAHRNQKRVFGKLEYDGTTRPRNTPTWKPAIVKADTK